MSENDIKKFVDLYQLKRDNDVRELKGENGNILKDVVVPQEPGLIDISGLSVLPFSNTFAGLKGIQLLKGERLARKASWAAERAKNAADSKRFATGLGFVGMDLNEVLNAKGY